MTITESLPLETIKKQLNRNDRISLVSCNSCVRFCQTGGLEEMKKVAKKLQKEGYNVIDMDLIGAACDLGQIKKEEFDGDVIIAFTCDAGIYNLEKLVKNKKIVPALKTTGIGTRDREGKVTLIKKF
jgi:hypothetical protein